MAHRLNLYYNDLHGFIRYQATYKSAYTEFYKGLTAHNKQKYKEAIEHYTAATHLNPRLAEAYNNCGNAMFEQYDDAITDYDEAIRINPQDANAYTNRGSAKFKQGL